MQSYIQTKNVIINDEEKEVIKSKNTIMFILNQNYMDKEQVSVDFKKINFR